MIGVHNLLPECHEGLPRPSPPRSCLDSTSDFIDIQFPNAVIQLPTIPLFLTKSAGKFNSGIAENKHYVYMIQSCFRKSCSKTWLEFKRIRLMSKHESGYCNKTLPVIESSYSKYSIHKKQQHLRFAATSKEHLFRQGTSEGNFMDG